MQVELSILATADASDVQTVIFADNTQLLNSSAKNKSQRVFFEVDNNVQNTHSITISMSGKNSKHTTIDNLGNILTDVMIKLDRIVIDEIDCTDIFCSGLKCYRHDANGAQTEFIDEFYGLLGCNGTVTFEFTTPIHLWFLKQTI
jgi:hypothetical protein